MELPVVVGEIRGFLDREGIPFAVVGALALHTYGYSRSTNDVDVLVGRDAQERLISFLENRWYFEESGQLERFHELERSL